MNRTRTRRSIFLAAVALMVAGTGCDTLWPFGSDPTADAPRIDELPRELTGGEVAVLEASNAFGFDLLRRIAAASPDSTHFISPLSASMALGMTLNGAAGETWEGMRTALRFGTGLGEDEINASYRSLLDLLRGLDPEVSFEIANSVWHLPWFVPLESFRDRVAASFDAEVRGLDFTLPGAADTINGWVRAKTADRIEEIVPDPIPADVVAYLLNAIHFKGNWRWRFDASETAEGPFHLRDGGTATVRYMTRSGGFRVGHTPEARVVELPYGGDAFAFTALVPRGGHTLEELVAGLDDQGWEGFLETLSDAAPNQELHLPRFTLEWERSLNEVLAAMGMADAFTGDADFSRMFEGGGVAISEVLQKTFVQVDEEGTEAAAVTSVEIIRVSLPEPVRLDRPFLFALRERLSGTILFLGVIVEPPLD